MNLSVNLNKVALIRNSRDTTIPSVTEMAQIAIDAGAHGITVHPRPDLRHATPQDVYDLEKNISVELNVEGNPMSLPEENYPGFMPLVLQSRPAQATLVPDDPNQKTSDHGWDLSGNTSHLENMIKELQQAGIRVSLFMESDLDQIRRAKDIGADRIELYTGPYADAFGTPKAQSFLEQYQQATECARSIGLGVNAGHDLNLDNLPSFCKACPVDEVSIGHALTVDALKMGFSSAVKEYLKAIGEA